jgi:hypothetical protein
MILENVIKQVVKLPIIDIFRHGWYYMYNYVSKKNLTSNDNNNKIT